MSQQVVLITGALTGIGRATALAFAIDGTRIVVSGRHDEAGLALAGELRGLGAEAEFIRADVRREDEVRNLVDQAVARFGRLDIAVNNAGTEGKPGPVTDITEAGYVAMMALYAGSKHAVEGITKSAAIEAAAYGVRVNAVAPGPTETGMLDRLTGSPEKKAAFYAAIPLKRGGTAQEVADAIQFVASAKAAFITGQIIRVNGGKTAS